MNDALKRRFVVAALVVAAGAPSVPARADEPEPQRWEFGIDTGVIYPVKGRQFGHDIPNDQVVNMLNTIGEGLAEEEAEGFAPIDPKGDSNIASTVPPLPELEAHFDYRVDDLWTVGLEGGWGFKRDTEIDQQGIYSSRFLYLHDQTQMFHFAPVARAGRSFGTLRATLTAGPEFMAIWEHADITFTDPDDSIKPYTIVRETSAFFGVVGGARVEWFCTEHGSLQLGAEYHKMFAPGGKFDYVTPKLGFVARF
jgi:hypothetical protein